MSIYTTRWFDRWAQSLVKARRAGELIEVNCNAQDEISDS